jgi:hypothetical protein
MSRLWMLLLVSACVFAQSPEELLRRVYSKMLDNLLHQPNYTCLETVERTRQVPGGSQKVADTVRLEVALVDGKEMFAWPGAKEFEDKELREVVSTGMFGNGNYGLYVRMIFGGGGPRLVYSGDSVIGGRQVAKFDFLAKAPASGYYLRVNDRKLLVGFRGSAYIDLTNGDLRRLEVIGQDIPAELGLTAAEDRIDYARTVIGDEEFLLPTESALLMAGSDMVSRNHTRFSACRKFQGESSVIFDDAELIEATEAKAVAEVELPRDTLLSLEIRSDFKLEGAAVGDAVEAVLRGDIRQGKEKLVAKGAVAKGRIVLSDHTDRYMQIAIRFTDLEWAGHHAPIQATFERRATIQTRGANLVSPDGAVTFVSPFPRSLKGEVLFYRTVR